ncbi:MAG: ribulose-phosphate 3-epimerase [Firmicutes bacterium]|nr:ribulose-phosphate 3-epimerase [Bacillota bacterium]MBQ4181880.1 ribulose-phosphate 3-epimerase [Bacillota bacterium]
MAKLAPSILSADFSRLADQIALIELGGADYVHMDVMDGAFVPNITFGGPVVKSVVGKTGLPFDIHLMIEHPEQRIPDFVTPQTEFIVVHQEACTHLHRVIQQIKDLGVKAGVALNPATPVSSLEYVLSDLDLVLVMSVNPGFGGQKFIPSAMDKIRLLDRIRREKDLHFVIEIDGGVNLKNAADIKAAGCDILVAGSAVFGADDIPARVREFQAVLA